METTEITEAPNSHDLCCPQCKNNGPIAIAAIIWVMVIADGTDDTDDRLPDHDTEWTEDSPARCPICKYSGKVRDFVPKEEDNYSCPNTICGEDLTKPQSILREYVNKDKGASVFCLGHYQKDSTGDYFFEPDESVDLSSGRYDLAEDSDSCIICDQRL
jgi:hypothetical protein